MTTIEAGVYSVRSQSRRLRADVRGRTLGSYLVRHQRGTESASDISSPLLMLMLMFSLHRSHVSRLHNVLLVRVCFRFRRRSSCESHSRLESGNWHYDQYINIHSTRSRRPIVPLYGMIPSLTLNKGVKMPSIGMDCDTLFLGRSAPEMCIGLGGWAGMTPEGRSAARAWFLTALNVI